MIPRPRRPGPAPVLFLALFAVQASSLSLSPVLPDVARDLNVSIAAAGQLRTVSGAAGAAIAVAVVAGGRRAGVRRLLQAGLVVLAAGALGSAVAPGFATLAAAQVAIGAGMALALAGGIAGAAEWSADGDRARVLAWALLGQPAAWVAGMPLIALLAGSSWRLVWLAVPLPAALAALGGVRGLGRRGERPLPEAGPSPWRRPRVAGWAAGELLAATAWSGTLLYAGALLTQSYGCSAGTAALVLGLCAAAYFPGTLLARRVVDRHARRLLVALGLAGALGVAVLNAVRPGAPATAALLAALMALVGARSLAASAFGLDAAPDAHVAITGMRSTTAQLGQLLGAAAGGAALSAGGWSGVAAVLGLAFALSAAPHLLAPRRASRCVSRDAWRLLERPRAVRALASHASRRGSRGGARAGTRRPAAGRWRPASPRIGGRYRRARSRGLR